VKARAFKAQAIGSWTNLAKPVAQVNDLEGFTVVGAKRKATEQPSPRSTQTGRKPLGKPAGSNATIMAGRSQSNKILTAFRAPESSQDQPQPSQEDQEV
jgi:hypothetical protein